MPITFSIASAYDAGLASLIVLASLTGQAERDCQLHYLWGC